MTVLLHELSQLSHGASSQFCICQKISLCWVAVISTLKMDWLCGVNYRLGDGPQRKQKEKGEGTFFILEAMMEHI